MMPNLITGANSGSFSDSEPKSISDEYAKGIDISPDSKLSKAILQRICRMADDSFSKMSLRSGTRLMILSRSISNPMSMKKLSRVKTSAGLLR